MGEFNNLQEVENICTYLVSLLASVLHGNSIPQKPEGITWEQLYEMAKFHSVESMAFYGARSVLDRESKLYEMWEQRRIQNLTLSLTQEGEFQEIIKKLTDAKIRVLPMKGVILRELYSQIDFRQMCDLDLLIDTENIAEAQMLMKNLGYEKISSGTDHHEIYSKKPYMLVELHSYMEPEESIYRSYYLNIWDKALPDKSNPFYYRMSKEDFYIYNLVHFARHYYAAGNGIRSLLDIYVYLQRYGDNLNQKYLEKELSVLKLSELCAKTEKISRKWFSESTSITKRKATDSELDIFLAGTHGSKMGVCFRSINKGKDGSAAAFLKYLWHRTFMSKEELRFSYPIVQKYAVMYPFCWFHRLCCILLFRRNAIKKELQWRNLKRKQE